MEEKKKVTAAQKKATAKYEKDKYFKTLVRFQKTDEQQIRAAAGDSLNAFIVSAVMEKIQKMESQTDQGEQIQPDTAEDLPEKAPFM